MGIFHGETSAPRSLPSIRATVTAVPEPCLVVFFYLISTSWRVAPPMRWVMSIEFFDEAIAIAGACSVPCACYALQCCRTPSRSCLHCGPASLTPSAIWQVWSNDSQVLCSNWAFTRRSISLYFSDTVVTVPFQVRCLHSRDQRQTRSTC